MVRRASPRPAVPKKAIVAGAVLVLFLLSNFIAYFYTDLLWFQELGIESVLWTGLTAQFAVGAVTGLLVAAFLWVNLWIAGRSGPVYSLTVAANDPLDQYREMIAPFYRRIRLAIALVIGFFTGLFASSAWQLVLLWANRKSFGVQDPQFGRDVSFYVFELPFYDRILDQLWSMIFLTLVLTIATYYLFGAIRPQRGLRGMEAGALAHISVLLGLIALVKAAQYYLGQFHLNFSPRGVVTGASYTDVHAQLPALRLLAVISVISAILFLVNIRFRRLSLPLAAVGIWIAVAFLAGGVWPAFVQRFSVEPQEPQREEPFIKRNIEATSQAFKLAEDDVETRSYPASTDLTAEQVEANESLLQNVRLWDPEILEQAYAQLQAIRTYYSFPDVDIDRYEIDGETRQVLLSARELSLEDLPAASQKWANIHLQFTHGYGLVASLANELTTAGQPDFLVRNIPGTTDPAAQALEPEQPRIYYGEAFDDDEYSIVASKQEELDYETDEGAERSSYEGEGGIAVGGLGRKLAFAVREGDPNFVLSNLITSQSKVLIYRNVRDRVLRAAPFLQVDQDPYPAVVEGRLVWIIDAYTSTQWYPYSQRYDSGLITGEATGTLSDDINYVRNSVKVTVDAYDGTMTFYPIDDEDPLIQAWRDIFPALFTDDAPSEELREHFRYPEDLFKLQSEVYRTYHIKDAMDFYSKGDEWEVPRAPQITGDSVTSEGLLSPTYLLFQLPGETEQEFVLTRPFTPKARPNMIAFMAARSDPDHYGELVNLQFPRQITVPGPVQVDNLINQDVEISRELTLLGQQGSNVSFGSLVILPIEEAILYVQPLFVTAADAGGIPELKKVVMVLGEEVVMEDTFEEALAALFDLEEPAAPTEPVEPQEPDDRQGPGRPDEDDARLQQVLQEAARLYERAQDALAEGDFETYGRLIQRLGRLLGTASR
ncbi:MAG: UPF0182 family protein [Actinomycetota bacterium]|nr:UPF0182 family protein [Actinomycetota bacterium]